MFIQIAFSSELFRAGRAFKGPFFHVRHCMNFQFPLCKKRFRASGAFKAPFTHFDTRKSSRETLCSKFFMFTRVNPLVKTQVTFLQKYLRASGASEVCPAPVTVRVNVQTTLADEPLLADVATERLLSQVCLFVLGDADFRDTG